MSELMQAILDSEEKNDLRAFISELRLQDKNYLLRNDILNVYSEYCSKCQKSETSYKFSNLGKLIYYTQEIIQEDSNFCFIIRPNIAAQEVYRLTADLDVEPMTVQELLDLRDRLVNKFHPHEGDLLELDFGPFYDYTPTIRDPKNIGKGVQYLNRYLSSKLFQDSQQWLESLFNFLRLHNYNGIQLLINYQIQSQQQLSQQVKKALNFVSDRPHDEPYEQFRLQLQAMGFEPGWGNTASRVRDTLNILDELIDSPDPLTLEAFISRIPMIFRIVLVSAHGWFGQEGVLGRPDTGGQVVYVLDQAKNLEKQLQEDAILAGLEVLNVQPKVIILTRLIPNSDGTLCNQRLEKVHGTENAWILRVPLREFNPKMTQNWISRFEFWPYLETFAIDSERELLAEFHGRPDLIVGNYTDGNLVAFLLARRMKVTQCNIAHALEKSKYLFSNLYWQDLEEKYHFSLQFTADLIAMNAANFVISSTYQEIVGTSDSVGQYESYKCFTMPELYHVVNGIELFSPKFNVVPPGVNENSYFPYTHTQDRIESDRDRLEEMLFTLEDSSQIFGKLDDPNKRPIFSMARLDRIKNLTGLAECFGKSKELQEHCNLILVAGKLRIEESEDNEERDEIVKLYRIIDEYNLHGKIRWLGVRLSKNDSGEIYRVICDRQGIFVQPALFEAFGLTILESMISGLPTFATQFGGPLEIIQDQINGFYINPTHLEETATKILDFVTKCEHNPNYWKIISEKAIDRVYSTYTWKIHTTKLLTLARIYGFWNFASKEKREDLLRYLESLFYLIYKPRAQQLLEQHKYR
ncbi:Sucrose synthase, glycosyl transferase, group 1 [Trichormus variabilis ATCC 29413]|uniref:Sucrose synthase n=2 Tax=Anabaena variabilis TaxID=264691 RepID=Q3MAT5_TRIV2|nr:MULTISPECIES: sucrose synthase [Nostocaceae]ABA21901.1 Sucrose synthase, glycosyl transferase, group 1 [Trichormus variabilis ATCC 29413]MBC1213402.1 sucrose synthase [Trichormus variabilis ARAD]MBC1254860.1 sucrose synthase [Trichormus variabilis V5]MBC1269726.1 sucrose synthase [Trichormus variabilis FSR]MBC1302394.1 sucrose synthase [Trichormus variabilis N2B]